MKLAEVRNLGIKYCEEHKIKFTYISHNNTEAFYLTDKEDKHTVFFVNKNGSLHPYRGTSYAADFHKELNRRRKNKQKNYKQKLVDAMSRSYEIEVES